MRRVVAMSILVACSSSVAGEVEADHTLETFVQSNAEFQWSSPSYQEFGAQWKALGDPWYRSQALPATHMLTIRMQQWIDRFDQIVRSKVLEQTGIPLSAPRPVAKIIVATPSTAVRNAWVNGAATCLRDNGGSNETRVLDGYGGVYLQTAPCLPNSWKRPEEFANYWNAQKEGCELENGKDVELKPLGTNPLCTNYAETSRAPLSTAAALPFVHFSTDLLQGLTEDAFAFVIAHELAHYYRAHTIPATRKRYRFWFEANTPDGRREPLPEALRREVEGMYVEVSRNVLWRRGLTDKWSPRTLGFALELGGYYLPRWQSAECAEAGRDLSPARDVVWSSSTSKMPQIVAYERSFEQCIAKRTISSVEQSELEQYLLQLGLEVPVQPGMTFQTLLHAVDDVNKKRDLKEAALVEKIRTNKIGFYTTEQEADEMAFELGVKIGLSPQQLLNGWVSVMEALHRGVGASCAVRMKEGFRTLGPDGSPIPAFQDLGDLSEDHHGDCYRLFNLWREVQAHKYEAQAEPPPPLSPEWEVVRSEAALLSK